MPPNNDQIALYVVRHGRTVLNAERCFRGNVNPELDSTGIKQAQDLKKFFDDKPVCAIFSSPKQRATKTADILSQGSGIPVHTSSSLCALDVGNLSGQPRSKENVKLLQGYLDNPDCPIPGGEALNQFRQRVDPCIREAIHIFMECGVPPMIVAHSSVVREVGHLLMGDQKKVLVEPGGVIAVYLTNGQLEAKPILKPLVVKSEADTIS